MNMTELIREKVNKELQPEVFKIINESHKHVGHAGHDGSGESHFKLIVVSKRFDDCNRIQAHRMVNDLLKPLFSDGLHALSLDLSAPLKR